MSYRFLFFHVSFFLLAEKNTILFTLRSFYRKHVVKYFVRKAMRFVLRNSFEKSSPEFFEFSPSSFVGKLLKKYGEYRS
jgi:hypothetical protein